MFWASTQHPSESGHLLSHSGGSLSPVNSLSEFDQYPPGRYQGSASSSNPGEDAHRGCFQPWCVGLLVAGTVALAALGGLEVGYQVGFRAGQRAAGLGNATRGDALGRDRGNSTAAAVTEERDPGEESRWGIKEMSFYMYRAQSDAEYAAENVNTADLAGVLWYLHNEIVSMTPRKYGVTRILRLRVTMKNTLRLFEDLQHQFGPFVAFDSGMCTVPTCNDVWNKYGFVVGCQVISGEGAMYTSQRDCVGAQCQAGVWYSLPGPCPDVTYKFKNEACSTALPGGSCSKVTGEFNCTYHVEDAGDIDLDVFSKIDNYTRFIEEGRVEYDRSIDRGVNYSFWNGIRDVEKCNQRMRRLHDLFAEKYPALPGSLQTPSCPGN